MKRLLPGLLALALATTACGDDGSVLGESATSTTEIFIPSTAAPSTTVAATTLPPTTMPPTTLPATTIPATTVPPTTTPPAPPPPSTTVAPTTTVPSGGPYEVDETDFFPDPLPGSDQAHGSGCVTGGAATLPDGIWFGFAEAVVPGTITFDLACYWTGAVAEAKAIADGEEAFDFYIRNMNPKTYQVPIAGSARVWWVDGSGADFFPTEIPIATWPRPGSYVECPSDYCGVWLYVNGGRATGIVEQYSP